MHSWRPSDSLKTDKIIIIWWQTVCLLINRFTVNLKRDTRKKLLQYSGTYLTAFTLVSSRQTVVGVSKRNANKFHWSKRICKLVTRSVWLKHKKFTSGLDLCFIVNRLKAGLWNESGARATRETRVQRARVVGGLQYSCCLPAKCNKTQILVIIELNFVASGVVTCKQKYQQL